MDLPKELRTPDFKLLDANDTIPSNIDPSTISYLSEFLWPPPTFFASNRCTTVNWRDNGVAHSFHTRTILDAGSIGDQGWTTVETVLIRLNTSFTPSGRFPVYSNESLPDADGAETRIGYDAAVCVEKYEPWIIEAYNTSIGSPTALRIVERGDGITSLLPSGNIRGPPIANTRYLNTTGKNPAFFVAHDNSINHMVKDNGLDRFYVPSPTVGLVVPSHHFFSDTDLLYRPFLSLEELDPRDTPNYPQTGSPSSAPESTRPTFYRTLWGRGASSHSRIQTRCSHLPLTSSGS